MRSTTHPFLFILAVSLVPTAAQGKLINPVSVNLHAEAHAVLDGITYDPVFPDEIAGAEYGSFFSGAIADAGDLVDDDHVEAVSYAELHATVAPEEVAMRLDWGFSINTMGEASYSSASGQIVFNVTRAVLFDLDLDFTSGFGRFDVVLQHEGADVWARTGTDGDAPFPAHVHEQRLLGPGVHTLSLVAETVPTAAGFLFENTMRFTLSPVPEPGTATLLGVVACGLIWPRRGRAAGFRVAAL